MKLGLVFLMIALFTLTATACNGLPDAQKEVKGSVDASSALGRVALEVPTIF